MWGPALRVMCSEPRTYYSLTDINGRCTKVVIPGRNSPTSDTLNARRVRRRLAGQSMRLSSLAIATADVRFGTSSFLRMLLTCFFTVCSVMKSWLAMSRFARPLHNRSSTPISAGVGGTGRAGCSAVSGESDRGAGDDRPRRLRQAAIPGEAGGGMAGGRARIRPCGQPGRYSLLPHPDQASRGAGWDEGVLAAYAKPYSARIAWPSSLSVKPMKARARSELPSATGAIG